MEIHGFTKNGSISITLDGVLMLVPDDMANGHRQMIAEWELQGNVIPPYDPSPKTFAEAKEALFEKLSDIRYQKEVGGTTFQNVPLKTDRESTAIITAAYITALGDPTFTMNWKVANGVFSTLTAEHIIAVGTVIRNHVQACFNHEMVISNLIHQATTKAELEAIDLEQGWPS